MERQQIKVNNYYILKNSNDIHDVIYLTNKLSDTYYEMEYYVKNYALFDKKDIHIEVLMRVYKPHTMMNILYGAKDE